MVKVFGTQYLPSNVLVVGTEDEFPVFAKVKTIYAIKDEVVFEVDLLHSRTFDQHYHAYLASYTNTQQYIKYQNLPSFLPLHLHSVPNCPGVYVIICKKPSCFKFSVIIIVKI